jgi:hypothetical protein
MAVHKVPNPRAQFKTPMPTIEDVYREVDRIDGKLTQVLNQLGEIKTALDSLSASVSELHTAFGERE